MRFPRGKSVTLRLTLLFAAVSTSVLLFLGVIIGNLVDRHFEELDSELLNGKLEVMRKIFSGLRTQGDLVNALTNQVNGALVGHHGLSAQILTEDGQILYSTSDFTYSMKDHSLTGSAIRVTTQDGTQLRILAEKIPVGLPESHNLIVQVATDLAHHEAFMVSFRLALWATVGLAAFASGLLGWFAARRGLAPLREISQNAARITVHHLDKRLPVEFIPIELADVARTLNEMLARLEESFLKLSGYSSELAHELRTPVSNLLTQTQVTLSTTRTAEEYKEILASNAEEFERLSKTISDMLFLAKAENNLLVPSLEQVNLRTEADGILEFYEVLAEESKIQLSIEGQAVVKGDRLMLRRAMSNLLSNAFRHTPEGGYIKVHIATRIDNAATVSVSNTGETIAPEHMPRLFDRFYRVDSHRLHDSERTGLGLAITRSIMRAHGGGATAQSSNGVTIFELWLPA